MKNSNRFLLYLCCVLEAGTQICIFLALLTLIHSGMNARMPGALYLVLGTAATGGAYLARTFLQNKALLLLAQLAAAAVPALCGIGPWERAAFIISGVLLFLFCIYKCTKNGRQEGEGISPFFVILPIMGILFQSMLSTPGLARFLLMDGCIFLLLSIIYRNASNMLDVIEKNERVASLPARQMSIVNGFEMAVVALLSGIFMFLGSRPEAERMVFRFLEILKNGLIWLLGLLFSGDASEPEPVSEVPAEKPAMQDMNLPPAEESILAEILAVLAKIIAFLVGIALVVFLIAGCFLAIQKFIRNIHTKNGMEEDVKEFLFPRNYFGKADKKERKDHSPFSQTPRGRCRKYYRMLIKKGAKEKKESISGFLPPVELSRKYLDKMDNRNEITGLYEKARYSRDGISEQEWKQWKKGG